MTWGEGQGFLEDEKSAEPGAHIALRLLAMVCPGGATEQPPSESESYHPLSYRSWWAKLPAVFKKMLCKDLRPHHIIKAIKRWLPVSFMLPYTV